MLEAVEVGVRKFTLGLLLPGLFVIASCGPQDSSKGSQVHKHFPGCGHDKAQIHFHAHGDNTDGHFHSEDSEVANMIEAREAVKTSEFVSKNIFDSLQGLLEGQERKCSNAFGIKEPAPNRKVVFTFDDGPDGLTAGLLDVLKKHQVKATFFVVGAQAVKYRSTLARIVRENHILASHSWDHPRFPKTPVPDQLKQIDDNEKELSQHIQGEKFFRFPYGWGTCQAWDYLVEKKNAVVGWHVDSCDWAFNKTGSVDDKTAVSCGVAPRNQNNYFQHVIDTVEEQRGGIILFHDAFRDRTVPQIDAIIIELKARGYSFTNLDDPDFQSSIWRAAPI